MNQELVQHINQSLGIALQYTANLNELQEKLTVHVNHLINTDFDKLVYYLYRIDVNEQKMRSLLSQTAGENAASSIATLIIERQLQKIETRNQHKADPSIPDDEKW
ncbi:MAG: hypothetical protein NTW29_12860 [Bacteroidetes bacterium]|nr:hypothetical protein [Bacteroidota bacterium]